MEIICPKGWIASYSSTVIHLITPLMRPLSTFYGMEIAIFIGFIETKSRKGCVRSPSSTEKKSWMTPGIRNGQNYNCRTKWPNLLCGTSTRRRGFVEETNWSHQAILTSITASVGTTTITLPTELPPYQPSVLVVPPIKLISSTESATETTLDQGSIPSLAGSVPHSEMVTRDPDQERSPQPAPISKWWIPQPQFKYFYKLRGRHPLPSTTIQTGFASHLSDSNSKEGRNCSVWCLGLRTIVVCALDINFCVLVHILISLLSSSL